MTLGAEARAYVLRRILQCPVGDLDVQLTSTTVDLADRATAEGTRRCIFNVAAHEDRGYPSLPRWGLDALIGCGPWSYGRAASGGTE